MARALLLNASFEPLCVVSARRAVVLVLKEKAEIVHRNGAEFRSERRDGAGARRVIRLVHFVRVPFRADARRSRAGRCSPATATAASTAGARPRTSTTSCRGRAAGPHTLGERRRVVPFVQRAQGGPAARRVRHGAAAPAGRAARDDVADRVGGADRSRLARVPRTRRGRPRVVGFSSPTTGRSPASTPSVVGVAEPFAPCSSSALEWGPCGACGSKC